MGWRSHSSALEAPSASQSACSRSQQNDRAQPECEQHHKNASLWKRRDRHRLTLTSGRVTLKPRIGLSAVEINTDVLKIFIQLSSTLRELLTGMEAEATVHLLVADHPRLVYARSSRRHTGGEITTTGVGSLDHTLNILEHLPRLDTACQTPGLNESEGG